MRHLGVNLSVSLFLLVNAHALGAFPRSETERIVAPDLEPDVVGHVDGTQPPPRKALQDTIWIANWTGDGVGCDDSGWTHEDGRITFDGLANGDIHWHLESGFSSTTGMSGNAAVVGYRDNACCVSPDGYDNGWYEGIRIEYTGAATLTLDFKVDSEAGYDFLQIETDSACASFGRVDYHMYPRKEATDYRDHQITTSGLMTDGEWNALQLPDYGPGTHCVYIAFFSDGGYSPCDGLQPTTLGAAAVVDNIVIQDADGTRLEDFEDGTLDLGSYVNMRNVEPFGTWARLYAHVTDNDVCAENTTCAWLWTDDTTPTQATDPSMAFGPGGYVVRNWLDDILISPWVSLASTPDATGTIIRFRRFPGNFFTTSRIVAGWAVRSRSADGCVSDWGHRSSHNSLSSFQWFTLTQDMTSRFDPTAEAIQIRHNVIDRQWLANSTPPLPFNPGPGPYVDDTRIGRVMLQGPLISEGIDARSQAQDAFPTEIDPNVTPAGEHYRPTQDRFGTCAFSEGTELGINDTSPNLITGDSIWVQVTGVRPGGDVVTSVTWSGAVVAGPHAGKAPPPYTTGANGFFTVDADSVRNAFTGQVLQDFFFIDFDDVWFRGGDEVFYFWAATDDGGGFSSDPAGLTAPPVSIAAAQAATQGLLEVSFLPTISWDPAYVARIQADAQGDLDPTAQELANSSQANCLLYVNHVNARRLTGDWNRTSFMYSLDLLGYRGYYDVYDHSGMGNTNNHLGGRATIEQAQGYSLIVYDAGNTMPGRPILPDGFDIDLEKIDQAGWFHDWLAQASAGEAQIATLWILGANVAEEKSGAFGSGGTLLNTDMGVQLQNPAQTLDTNPEVQGVASFTFQRDDGTATVDFTTSQFALSGGCPSLRSYDPLATSTATAVVTHVFVDPITHQPGDATIVMNANEAASTNTILQSHAWFDIRDASGTPSAPELGLLSTILGAVLPTSCGIGEPVDAGPTPEIDVPPHTVLHGNVPNPFNPMTRIRFDLAHGGRVSLRLYDVGGHLVRRLLEAHRPAGRDLEVVWDGRDDHGRPLPSGVYVCRLEADATRQSRKMLLLR